MSNQIKLKRGSGSDPGTSDLVVNIDIKEQEE